VNDPSRARRRRPHAAMIVVNGNARAPWSLQDVGAKLTRTYRRVLAAFYLTSQRSARTRYRWLPRSTAVQVDRMKGARA
jgi:hypothetical protein